MSNISVDFDVLNQRGSPAWFTDTFANIPTAGFVGRMFISKDTFAFYRDTGSGWDLIGGPGIGTLTGSGVVGQVSYFNGTQVLAGNNNLFWDNTNGRLGINNSTPANSLDIIGTGKFTGVLTLGSTISNGTNSYTLPNATGTIAILEAGTQTFTGTLNVLGSLGTKYGISIEKGNTPSPLSFNDIFIYALSGATNIINFANSSYISSFSFPTSNQTFTLPSATGTLALTSDLSSYLPLAGGTLTGALIGTSATFSGALTAGGATNGAKLHVLTNSGVSYIFETQAGLLPTYQYRRSGASLANLTNGDAVASMEFIARANSSWLTIAKIYAEYSGNGTTQSGNLQFYTSNAGSEVERMRITSGGDVTIGSAIAATNVTLNINGVANKAGRIVFQESASNKWLIGNGAASENGRFEVYDNTNGTGVQLLRGATAWIPLTSDVRLKKNFETCQGLNEVLQIEPVKYHLLFEDDNSNKKLGFKAQNIQSLIPEMVVTNGRKADDGSDYLTIVPDYLLPVLVKAIQELNEKLVRNNIN